MTPSYEPGEDQPRVVVRDKRRIDPETGAVRVPPSAPPGDRSPAEPVQAGMTSEVVGELAERTEDLKRVSAEYANYRRRVDRDRILIGELAQERLLLDLLPVLDDIDRAREHGDLTGAFKSAADRLAAVLDRAAVVGYGEIGDRFDPGLHEAVLHSVSAEITEPTCTYVMRRGYQRGGRVLRPAMVGVADPETVDPGPADPETVVRPTVSDDTQSTVEGSTRTESTVDDRRTD